MPKAMALLMMCLTLAALPVFADDAPPSLRPGEERGGEDLYKDASLSAHEEGRCVVRITVGVAGRAVDQSIEKSSGSANLDWSCLKWAQRLRFVAATHNGQPVQATISVPMTWAIKPLQAGTNGKIFYVGSGEIK